MKGMGMEIGRRATLLGLGAAFTLGPASLALAAAATDRRFVVILLRGALDGLSAVQPYGDPALAGLRGGLALPEPGREGGVLDLGGRFGLHPVLGGLHGLYRDGDLAILHATAGHYRSRSHFDAQDYLESGADRRMDSGWLNRVAQALPPHHGAGSETALSVGATVALLLRGRAPVGAWMPQGFVHPDAALYRALAELHHGDPLTGPAIAEGLKERGFTAAVLRGTEPAKNRFAFPALAEAAGRLLAAAEGPRLAAMEVGGWDTHVAQKGRLAGVLRQLDAGMVALRRGLGEAWGRSVVLAVTEFGRTVRENGTGGTDHGTATVAFLAGGAVAGGRVLGEWPGLGSGRLFENRDLAPTSDLRSLAKGALAAHLGLGPERLAAVFPDSASAAPMAGLLRA
jgi:uncharacterized protein (DUF1501 family)